MLHLAQVQKNSTSDGMTLQLLAAQTAEDVWVASEGDAIAIASQMQAEIPHLHEGLLVLVNLDENRQILALENAKDWVLGLLQKSRASAEVDAFCLEDEESRIEQWRQELTSQSQDITRRNLEIETRREQIQALEASLEQEKEELKLRWQELKQCEEQMKRKQ